jgi:RimJ/RimL family protein N-acetyltransferase
MTSFPREPDGRFWWQQLDRPERCHYFVVLPDSGDVIGVYAFVRIDWERCLARNMGCFVRSDLCSQGYGSETLQPLLAAVLQAGMRIIRLGVKADNAPAIRCYQTCGMQIVDEMLDEQIRFYVMEITAQPYQSMVFDPATVEHLLDADPKIVTRHLTMFLETGIIRHPIHALLYKIARQQNAACLDIFEHTLLSYDGAYVYEDAMLLTDIVNTLVTVNASGSKTMLSAFRHKLSHIAITPDDVNIGSAKQIERLISLCQKHGE